MSHLASRLLADWLRDDEQGINAHAPNVPLLDGDSPPETVTVYNDLDDAWVAERLVPGTEADPDVEFPCVLVATSVGRFEDGTPQRGPDGYLTEGSVTVVLQCCVRDPDHAAANRQLMYLLRATRNAVMGFSTNDAEAVAARASDLGIQLLPATGTEQGRGLFPMGDAVATASLLVTFPVQESVLFT